jgi:hypothetical protein
VYVLWRVGLLVKNLWEFVVRISVCILLICMLFNKVLVVRILLICMLFNKLLVVRILLICMLFIKLLVVRILLICRRFYAIFDLPLD